MLLTSINNDDQPQYVSIKEAKEFIYDVEHSLNESKESGHDILPFISKSTLL